MSISSSGFTIMKKKPIGIVVAVFVFILPVLLIYQNLSVDEFLNFAGQKGKPSSSPLSCLSRNQSVLYRRPSPHKPSSYLQSRLLRYEHLHRKCGPYTEPYKRSIQNLKSGNYTEAEEEEEECKYVVWLPLAGLGNKIISLASAFLYALLTNRVLLIDPYKDMSDLFCEPFPESSWLLPLEFPLYQFRTLGRDSPQCFGSLLKRYVEDSHSIQVQPYVYLYLVHDYSEDDKRFFCDQEQSYLRRVPWLILTSNTYFLPSFFLMSSFEQELGRLFPSKDAVFHHLGRYLFHPSDEVWGFITNYYGDYLANADERVGIQVRVFNRWRPVQSVYKQIVGCLLKENLLPEIDHRKPFFTLSKDSNKSKAVLVTSLNSDYFEMLKKMYSKNPTVTGEIIRLYQPSHEGHQYTGRVTHDRKAWAEMYLLSLTDVLITSGKSTFGYVAQSLGGLKPWILYKPLDDAVPDPPCGRAMSMEPCFQAPPSHNCKGKTGIDAGALDPHVRHCEDMEMRWGLKLLEPDKF